MKYKVNDLDQKTMSVQEFLQHEKEIPYYRILAGYKDITLSELYEKYYDKTIFFYNEPKDFGVDEDGNSMSFDRLIAEVKL